MSDPITTAPPAPAATRTDLPCGCWRAISVRQVPAIHCDDKESPYFGTPKYDENGTMLTEPREDVEEAYCPEHSAKIADWQQAVQKVLSSGRPPTSEEALALMGSPSPFPMLEAGTTEHVFVLGETGGGRCACGVEFTGENPDEEFAVHAAEVATR